MSRWLIAIALLVSVLGSSGTAGEDKQERLPSVSPSAVARLILEADGPQQAFAAQYLRQADHATLLKVQAALRELAPAILAEAKARGPEPAPPLPKSGPLELVTIELRMLQIAKDSQFFRDIRVHVKGDEPDHHATVQYFDDTQVAMLLRAVEKSEVVTQLTAPRLTVYDGQLANVSLMNRTEYVRDVELVGADRAPLPVMDVALEGLVFGVRPRMSADRKYITIEMEVSSAVLEKPMRTHAIQCGGKTFELQVPHVDLGLFRTTVRIPDEGSFLLDNLVTIGEGGEAVVRLALVTARVSKLDASELPRPPDARPDEKPAGDGRKPAGK